MGSTESESSSLDELDIYEEITVGLPAETREPARLDERFVVNRYLLQGGARLLRELFTHDRVDSFLAATIAGVRRLLGCDDVELLLHDPVGAIAGDIRDWSSLYGMLKLTPDSEDITSLYGELPSPQWLSPELARGMGVFLGGDDDSDVFILPLVDGGIVVGSLHLEAPNHDLLETEADLELLHELTVALPVILRKASATQATSDLVLLDPLTHVANRNGMERDLERELGRARRAQRTVSLMAITLCGLEAMGTLSQRHLQARVLKTIANRISGGLRVTDSAARLGTHTFGVLVADAGAGNLADIAMRYENDLRGHAIDDGLGGFLEINPCAVWVTVSPAEMAAQDVQELAARMIEATDNKGDCAFHGEVHLDGSPKLGEAVVP